MFASLFHMNLASYHLYFCTFPKFPWQFKILFLPHLIFNKPLKQALISYNESFQGVANIPTAQNFSLSLPLRNLTIHPVLISKSYWKHTSSWLPGRSQLGPECPLINKMVIMWVAPNFTTEFHNKASPLRRNVFTFNIVEFSILEAKSYTYLCIYLRSHLHNGSVIW